MKNGNQIQSQLANGVLYQAVNNATLHVRDSYEYDNMREEDRRLAILCHALETALEPLAAGDVRRRLVDAVRSIGR